MVNSEDYGYFLPESNLALEPAVPRDLSKLFVYDTKTDQITFDQFFNLNKHLPNNSFLVLNDTKVLPARVILKKESGGKVIILFLVNELTHSTGSGQAGLASLPSESEGLRVIRGMVDRKVNIGAKLFFEDGSFIEAIKQKENIFDFKFKFSKEKLFTLLQKFGNMPIPPYLKKSTLTRNELMEKYQTIFARAPVGARLASSAAPTASLHFTDSVFKNLKEKGIKKYFVTLHVGLGTFAPITERNIKQKKLHEEYYEINKSTIQSINRLKNDGEKLVAVGTTVTRTLESISDIKNQKLKIFGKTDLFIFPPYDFKMADIMITNFHLPKSSLMMLVEAFLQHKKAKRHLIDLYNMAIKNNFRFYSFGDAMLIL